MKTIKTTARMIALTFIMGMAINMNSFASPVEEPFTPVYFDAEMMFLLESEEDFNQFESEMRAEGVMECENTEIITVLGENDEIVYQGSHQLEDENNAFLTRLLTKADFIMTSGGKSFYKVF